MHFVYGECGGKARAAARRYTERFAERRLPQHETIAAVCQRLRDQFYSKIKMWEEVEILV
jgi:hypothetical protein